MARTEHQAARLGTHGRPRPPGPPPGVTWYDLGSGSTGAPVRRPAGRGALRVLAGFAVVGMLSATALLAGGIWLERSYDANIRRIGDPFRGLHPRPAVVAPDARNILLLGSRPRGPSDIPSGGRAVPPNPPRADAIMMAHIPADRSFVAVTSIPRDSWVDVPGHGMARISAALPLGGARLMVKTVEQYTGVRVDHVVVLDLGGFRALTDALGGVTVVSQRHDGLRAGLERVERQQSWIRAIAARALDRSTITNPLKLNGVLGAASRATSVDDGFTLGEMRSTLLSLRQVRAGDICFVTAPVAGVGLEPDDGRTAVRLDGAANRRLWQAVRDDAVSTWLAAH